MHSRMHSIAVGLVVVAVVPYTALKVLWLGGSTIGIVQTNTVEEVQSARMVVGNVMTIVLELLAVGLAVALTRPWGLRVPAWIVVGLAGGATGLLAPILLGLPLGSVIQFAIRGDLHTSGMDNMAPWVFALAYGGFALLAIAIAALAWGYTLTRWGRVLAAPPSRPAGLTLVVGALGMVPFAVAMVTWGLLGPGSSGPEGMDALSQRTALVVTGLLCVSGFLAPILGTASRRPHGVWLATWVGCTTAALQGPTQVLLANGGDPQPAILAVTFLATPASCAYGLLTLRRRIVDLRSSDAGSTAEQSVQDQCGRARSTLELPEVRR